MKKNLLIALLAFSQVAFASNCEKSTLTFNNQTKSTFRIAHINTTFEPSTRTRGYISLRENQQIEEGHHSITLNPSWLSGGGMWGNFELIDDHNEKIFVEYDLAPDFWGRCHIYNLHTSKSLKYHIDAIGLTGKPAHVGIMIKPVT